MSAPALSGAGPRRLATCASSCGRAAPIVEDVSFASAPARSSASSASRAAARRRPRWRCSATPGPGARIAGGSVRVDGRGDRRPQRARAAARCAGGSSSYVPQDPGDRAEPVDPRRRPHRARCCGRTPREATRGRARRSPSASTCRPTARSSAASRTSSRAASSSGSRSRSRWSASRRSSCSTSRRRVSTSSRRRASSTSSGACARELASPWSTSRTTSRSSPRSPTASR